MTKTQLSITFDYRCPFARNANEHLIRALEAGIPIEATFLPFSLDQAHVGEGDPPVWDDPRHVDDLLANQVGLVVRDRFPEQFPAAHLALFSLRHDHGGNLRSRGALSSTLSDVGLEPDRIFAEIQSGWPLDQYRHLHEKAVANYNVFGVPTFIADDQSAFVRIMTRPGTDASVAVATIERIVDLLINHSDMNEFKRTTIPA
jgi:hypothetical protein